MPRNLIDYSYQLRGFAVYHLAFFYYLILVPFLDRYETEKRFRGRLRQAIRLAFWGFRITVRVDGESNFSRTTPAIIVSNHSSWFDQLALLAYIDAPITFMANKKYFSFPGLNVVLRKLQCIPVDTKKRSFAESLAFSEQLLKNGTWVVVYPEGTRSEKMLPLKRGAAYLAHVSGMPIQPIRIHGAYGILPRRQSFLRVKPGTITLSICPQIKHNPKGLLDQITSLIEKSLKS